MKNKKRTITFMGMLFTLGMILLGPVHPVAAVEPNLAQYSAVPIILSSVVKPNVLIILDNSTSMLEFAYNHGSITGYSPSQTPPYDGIFEPDAEYSYDATNNFFYTPKNAADTSKGVNYWEGKFLNWVCTRKIDVAKLALTGGFYESILVSGATVVLHKGQPFITGFSSGTGANVFQTQRQYNYDSVSTTETYTHATTNGNASFTVSSISGKTFKIRVKVNAPESGIIQDVGSKVNFGYENYTTKSDLQGGKIIVPIQPGADPTTMTNTMVTNANDMKPIPDSGSYVYTPMGESFFTAMGYFAQHSGVDNTNGPLYHSGDYTTSVPANDPYGAGDSSCVKSFVIFISDGEANNDSSITSTYRPAFTGEVTGSDNYLDNVAYYAHTHDLRDGGFGPSATGFQSLTLYTISTFGGGEALLKSAAKWGGFVDKNSNNTTNDTTEKDEWDANKDSVPDNYFSAATVSELKLALSSVMVNLLGQVSSGSAISMISTNASGGEGTVIQAYFYPIMKKGTETVKWTGHLQSFWLDDKFNLREDTNSNLSLDKDQDRIIRFFVDANGNTKIAREEVSAALPYGTGTSQTIDLADVLPIWDAGKKLQDRSVADRNIFTFLDTDEDGIADDSDTSDSHLDTLGEVVRFKADNAALLQPYLGVTSGALEWSYLGNTADRAYNLINWIRGDEDDKLGTTDTRTRKIDAKTWKLGDIIDSTPTTIADPQQRYDVVYKDATYTSFRTFVQTTLNRETVTYVGANDGMLHAFTNWKFNNAAIPQKFESTTGTEAIGDELWAYIPQALLPHLKWLADKNYDHVYYVDLTPMVMDARIFTADAAKHPDGWGTILLCGLNWGGKQIQVPDFYAGPLARDFYSSYFCLDITNPRQPRVLWERSYKNLGFSTSMPTVVRVGDDSALNLNKSKWFAAFGSGPTGYSGATDQAARIFVVDLATGEPYTKSVSTPKDPWLYMCTETSSGVSTYGYINSPVSYDKYLDYDVDGVYFGESYKSAGGSWKGKIWKLPVPADLIDPSKKQIDAAKWNEFYSMLNFNAPITGAASVGVGKNNTPYVFFGTGRYVEQSDKSDTSSQYLVGLIDPQTNTTYNLTTVTTGLWDVLGGGGDITKGWYYTLTGGERSLTKPIAYAGAAIFTTFKPNSDLCGFGGDGRLYINDFYFGSLLTNISLGTGNPSRPIIRPTSNSGRGKIEVLGSQSGGAGGNSAISIGQSSTGAISTNAINLPSIPRSKFYYWREP